MSFFHQIHGILLQQSKETNMEVIVIQTLYRFFYFQVYLQF